MTSDQGKLDDFPSDHDTTPRPLTPPPAENVFSTAAPPRKFSPQYPPAVSSQAPSNIQTQWRDKHPVSSPAASDFGGLSPGATDRVYPIRSAIQVDPTATPAIRQYQQESYFGSIARSDGRRASASSQESFRGSEGGKPPSVRGLKATADESRGGGQSKANNPSRLPPQAFQEIMSNNRDADDKSVEDNSSLRPTSAAGQSVRSIETQDADLGGHVTARFKHVIVEGGHAVITGRDGDVLQRCEDEPIHIPGAIQGFGLLIALAEHEGKFQVRVVSENSKRIIGYTPKQLFDLDSFTDILSEEQADNLLDHIDFIREEEADVATNGPEVFTMSIRSAAKKRATKLWCAMHVNDANPDLIICEFELEDDVLNPLVPANSDTPDPPEDTLNNSPTAEEIAESTQNISKPLRVLRSARKRKGEAAAMEVFNIMSQVQEQLASAPSLDRFLKVLVGVVKELTGFHRVMIYQFDHTFNGRVVTELVDPRATKDLYLGLHFPASDIPKQARDLYKVNKVRMLYDRDQETARLVCKTPQDLETPLDLTYSYLRAMSPIHIKYLTNMAVRSSMSISINAFGELWGLISCHSYGATGMRVAFPIRKMCRLVGDTACRNIERLSYASRLQARKLINTVPSEHNPSGYIIASSDDLLKLFNADCGLLSIRDETKILGRIEQSQEALVLLEYLRMRKLTAVMTSQDITQDFPDLKYPPGFTVIAGLLFVPLSAGGHDFILFFRKGQMKEVKWAGNPYEKMIKQGTEGYLEPRKSFKTWSETVVGRCREWSEEEVETAAVLCLVYGKFIEVWRQKEAALQNSQLTRLLLANSAHEVRTPLNAIINYLEIALEGVLDSETRENLAKSHSASKSLIYVINDLLDLTKTEEGFELVKGESFDLKATLKEATDPFAGDAKRKSITYEVIEYPGLPTNVLGDQRRIRQAISNLAANAIQHTSEGGVKVELYVAQQINEQKVEIELVVTDTGAGMDAHRVDSLFRDLEQVQSEPLALDPFTGLDQDGKQLTDQEEEKRTLGLGLAVVARIIRNMNGQMRLKSEEGKGSRFVLQFPFDLPDGERQSEQPIPPPSVPVSTPEMEVPAEGEVTLIKREDYVTSRRSSRSSGSDRAMVRRESNDSLQSKKSAKSMKSMASGHSARSDVDRLIEAIQEPHLADGKKPTTPVRQSWNASTRPKPDKRHSYAGGPLSPTGRKRAHSVEHTSGGGERSAIEAPGTEPVLHSGTPIRAVRVPEEDGVPVVVERPSSYGAILGEVRDTDLLKEKEVEEPEEPAHSREMHVLVAEDDPVNSKIVKKRMERFGHNVHLTTNGEECASAYGEESVKYDLVLMDMQMPIVDGLTSTKMIRSFEKTNPSHKLSKRAALNNRIPIIAVSASLVERERQTYIDAGFDAWILKPISFDRLQVLVNAIVDSKVREECLYKPGAWEKGGWFDKPRADARFQADTKPNTEQTVGTAVTEEVKMGARGSNLERAQKDGAADDEESGEQRDEKPEGEEISDVRDMQSEQEENAPVLKSRSAPAFFSSGIGPMSSIMGQEHVGTPEPMEEQRPPS